MLFVPYSSIMAMMFWRSPVRMEAIEIAVITPITIPRTVKKLRNLWERTLSSAIASVSPSALFGSRSFIQLGRLCQSENRIEFGRSECGIYPRDHSDNGRNDDCQQDVTNRYRHRYRSKGSYKYGHAPSQ